MSTYLRCMFYGDSFTSGENSGYFSYVNHLRSIVPWLDVDISNHGIGRTTFGEYSLYPVEGKSFLQMLHETSDEVRESDIVFAEYGLNDASATIIPNTVSINEVVLSMIKCRAYIREINPECKVIFLKLPNKCLGRFTESQAKYLNSEYLSTLVTDGFSLLDTYFMPIKSTDIYLAYLKICEQAKKIFDGYMNMFPTYMTYEEINKLVDTSGMYPNVEGHKLIPQTIYDSVFKCILEKSV